MYKFKFSSFFATDIITRARGIMFQFRFLNRALWRIKARIKGDDALHPLIDTRMKPLRGSRLYFTLYLFNFIIIDSEVFMSSKLLYFYWSISFIPILTKLATVLLYLSYVVPVQRSEIQSQTRNYRGIPISSFIANELFKYAKQFITAEPHGFFKRIKFFVKYLNLASNCVYIQIFDRTNIN